MSSPPPRMVVVGTSMGGLQALGVVLAGLGADFPLPLVVVQHRGTEGESATLVGLLQRRCALPVSEAMDKERIAGGHVYIAPPDYHLLVDAGALALSVDERVSYARPSIDVLFESAADAYREQTVAVVLTGANADGARGAKHVRERGGVVVVQEPREAEAPQMPRATIAAGAADHVLPLAEIAAWLNVTAQRDR